MAATKETKSNKTLSPDDLPLVAHNQGIMSSLHHTADWGPAADLQPEQADFERFISRRLSSFLPVARFPGPRDQRQSCRTGTLKSMQPRNL